MERMRYYVLDDPSAHLWGAFVLGFRAVVAAWRMECTVGASLACLAAR